MIPADFNEKATRAPISLLEDIARGADPSVVLAEYGIQPSSTNSHSLVDIDHDGGVGPIWQGLL